MPIAVAVISEPLERCLPRALSWPSRASPSTSLSEDHASVPTSLPHLNVLIESHT